MSHVLNILVTSYIYIYANFLQFMFKIDMYSNKFIIPYVVPPVCNRTRDMWSKTCIYSAAVYSIILVYLYISKFIMVLNSLGKTHLVHKIIDCITVTQLMQFCVQRECRVLCKYIYTRCLHY